MSASFSDSVGESPQKNKADTFASNNKQTLTEAVFGDLCADIENLAGRQSITSTSSIDTKNYKDCLSFNQQTSEDYEEMNCNDDVMVQNEVDDEEAEDEGEGETVSLNLAASVTTVTTASHKKEDDKGDGEAKDQATAPIFRTSAGSGDESLEKDQEEEDQEEENKEVGGEGVLIIDEEKEHLLGQYHHLLNLLCPQLEAATGLPMTPATLEAAFSLADVHSLLKQHRLASLTDLLLLLQQQPMRLRYQPQVVVISGEEELKKLMLAEKKKASQEEEEEEEEEELNSSKAASSEEEEVETPSVMHSEEQIYYFPNKLQFVTEAQV